MGETESPGFGFNPLPHDYVEKPLDRRVSNRGQHPRQVLESYPGWKAIGLTGQRRHDTTPHMIHLVFKPRTNPVASLSLWVIHTDWGMRALP